MKVFIAGVMQGNRRDEKINSQHYRKKITKILVSSDSNIEIIDPDITDPNRVNYTNEQATEMFSRYNLIVCSVDLLIAYIPEASMGTAVEMWEAWKNKIPIIAISPLKHNWVIKLFSLKLYPTIGEFAKDFKKGNLNLLLKKFRMEF